MKIFVSIAVLLLLGLGVWKLVEWRNQPPEISFIQATKGPIASEVSTNGRVDPSESAEARASTSGRVDRILIRLKQNVNKEEVLAELDMTDLRHEIDLLNKRKDTERAQLTQLGQGARPVDRAPLEAEIRNLDVELANARRNYETEQRLLSQNAGTRQAVEQAKQQVDTLESRKAGLNQRLNSFITPPADLGPIQARMQEIDAQIKQIETRLQQAIIRAPIAGTVFKFDLKAGAYLNPGDSIATIGKLDPVHVLVYVDEPDLGRVKKGMKVAITWEGMRDRAWQGTVDRLPSQIQALDSRRVGEVQVVIPNPDLDLLPGTNVSASILAEQVSDAITIPKEAIFTKDGKPGVYVLEGDRIRWKAVTQGVNNVTRVQINELNAGDTIALPSESATLTDGMQVRPLIRE